MAVVYFNKAQDKNTSETLSPEEIKARFSRRKPNQTRGKVRYLRSERVNWYVTSEEFYPSLEYCDMYKINEDIVALRVKASIEHLKGFSTIAIRYAQSIPSEETNQILEDCLDARLIKDFAIER